MNANSSATQLAETLDFVGVTVLDHADWMRVMIDSGVDALKTGDQAMAHRARVLLPAAQQHLDDLSNDDVELSVDEAGVKIGRPSTWS